ncbi:hypothetical protein APX70_04228, partial [Pseudomonas syringae pv. maculicola]
KLLITAGTTLKDAPLIMIRQAPDMTSKAMTGVSQFVVKHVTWKFLAIRIGIGLSRRLVAIMSRQQAQAAKQEAT